MSKSTIEADVKRVMSARGRGEGGRRLHVQCCVPGCLQTVRKLRLHIRRSHKKLCPLSCSACQARFVGQNDLNNHHRNGCSRVMSERGTGKGTRGKRVQCPKCFTTVRKLRLHIRKFHKELCRVSCSDCQARFVEQNDLNNHHRDGCPRRKHISYRVTATPGSLIETFFENVNFSDCSAVNNFIADELQLDKTDLITFLGVLFSTFRMKKKFCQNIPCTSI
ncbi:uncharacterized protein LOC110065180 [Orbicella faveolata]|uniref:uncharacterized protein LOC110065180 n=1 Tax=Orbicella faveolata TaxID=48498 RepID=UPI0009E2D92E|nr:uncharacterized protein LOC110065180 [Orbicella faveolata]